MHFTPHPNQAYHSTCLIQKLGWLGWEFQHISYLRSRHKHIVFIATQCLLQTITDVLSIANLRKVMVITIEIPGNLLGRDK